MKQKLIMMVGLPGSGKTMKTEEICTRYNIIGENCKVFSSDAIREELTGDVNDQEHNAEVFEELHKRIHEQLSDGGHAIYDATNLNYKRRKAFLDQMKSYDVDKVCVFMAVPFRTCCSRNLSRDRVVPPEVMARMYEHITIPDYFEGWDDIVVEYDTDWWDEADTPMLFMQRYIGYPQDNPHHTKTLGEHLMAAYTWMDKYLDEHADEYDHDEKVALRLAAVLHDCGKPYCRSVDEDGVAHYIGHENVGAYDSLFYRSTINMMDVAHLIQWHMIPMKWSDKTSEKYQKLWGKRFYDMVMLLHQADVEAK